MLKNFGKLELASLTAILIVYLVLIFTAPSGFWIVDEGNKFLWAKNLFDNGAYLLKDRAGDISHEHTAFIRPFSMEAEPGSHITSFSPIFITLIAPFAGIWGLKSALLFTAIISIFLIINTGKFAGYLGVKFNFLHILILGLMSPLLFYSITLWEHGLAILLGLYGMNLTLSDTENGNKYLFAGILLAAAVFIRFEMVIFGLGAWLFIMKRNKKIIFGGVAGFAIFAGLNYFMTGHFLPLSLTANYLKYWSGANLSEILFTRMESVYKLLFESDASVYLSAGIIVSAVMFFFLRGMFKFVFPVLLLGTMIFAFFDTTPFYNIVHRNSLLFTAPFFFMSLAVKTETSGEKHLKYFAIFTILFTVLTTPVYSGVHFGSRILLSSLPLLAILSASELEKTARLKDIFKLDALYGLIIAQALAAILGVYLLNQRRAANDLRGQIILEKSKTTLISNQWWLQQEIPDLHYFRDFYLIETPLELKEMLIDYYEKGIRFFTLLVREGETGGLYEVFHDTPPKQIGAFKVDVGFPSMNLVGLNYAIGFDAEGAAALADELGVHFGQIGRMEKSEHYLKLAAAWDSSVGKYHYNLGYCLGKLKKYDEALQSLERAVELSPENKAISRLAEELKASLELQEGK